MKHNKEIVAHGLSKIETGHPDDFHHWEWNICLHKITLI